MGERLNGAGAAERAAHDELADSAMGSFSTVAGGCGPT